VFDFIGDIHGHADELVALLKKLGYRMSGGIYHHTERKAFFAGDFIYTQRSDIDFGKQFARAFGGHIGLVTPAIRLTEKNRAREIRWLDLVEINEQNVADSDQGQVFDNFIAESTGTDYQNPGIFETALIPPADKFEP